MKTAPILAFAVAVLAAPATAAPHVHGVAALQVAVDGNQLQLDFISPLDNLVGFEHAPRTARQKQAWQAMQDKLRQPQLLFDLPAAASCVAQPAQVRSTLDGQQHAGQHRHGKHDDHASLDASYRYECAAPAALRSIEVRLFAAFPKLRRLQVEVAAPSGQSAATLTPAARRVRW